LIVLAVYGFRAGGYLQAAAFPATETMNWKITKQGVKTYVYV